MWVSTRPSQSNRMIMPGHVRFAVAATLILFGVTARLMFDEIPNFAPISAIALFAGFILPSLTAAAFIPLTIMLLSDLFLSGYEPGLRVIVYAAVAAPVLLRSIPRDAMRGVNPGEPESKTWGMPRMIGCVAGVSVAFYLSTNFATWVFSDWYSKDWNGLRDCMWAGLAFLKYTLAGDLVFALLLFGGYALAMRVALPTSSALAPPADPVRAG